MHSHEIESLYRAHGHVALRRARGLLGNEEDAREIVQEVFTSLLDHPTQIRGEASMTTWLYSATTHGCLNRLRNQRTRARLLEGNPVGATIDGGAPHAESRAILRDVLARLPDELARAAVYFYADEMTHDEIATVLGCSRRHVGDLITRLRAQVDATSTASPAHGARPSHKDASS